VQDAVERALATWPRTGLPDSKEAWLVSVAANCHRDRVRRGKREERHADALAALADMSPWIQGAIAWPEIERGWKDDLLRLIFACCHPSLEVGESAALALATVLGLTSREVAAAFGVARRAMDQRLTRARRRLRERGDYDAPSVHAAEDRLESVLAVIHLLFSEGYWSTCDDAPIRGELCRLAIGLGRSLYEILPSAPEVIGLLALMTLHEARRPARLDPAGRPVPLWAQDRSRWDREAIITGTALVEKAIAAGAGGPYPIEAAISAVHSSAKTAADTDWSEIAELYGLLEQVRPTAAVRANRAFAVARACGVDAGLRVLDEIGPRIAGQDHDVALVRGALLEEVDRLDEAVASLEDAVVRARNADEARQIRERIERIQARRRA
jgi:RNA polymerase sigma-70 factor (ECF subfamily)